MKRAANQFDLPSYPLVQDIYEVVPLPFTQDIPVQPHQKIVPNSLRMIRRVHGTAPSFPDPIHRFTIPGSTLAKAQDFVTAMQATVFWNAQRTRKRKSGDEPTSGRTGRPVEHSFRLDFKCPRARTYTAVPNSRKNRTLSRKCDCKAQFSIFHQNPD
ncbi:hypothetical protein PGTUg99_009332 [Puccinia graminis f. sp. tritici]|uniref:Uncharacterized protein n=1 Tax=Puccinia graminis f. sp. tritici TaxID=56615 RepID=A0A5B0PWH3_PUCGR|nr:hypothetical protein PGTUg99_009332 [Puccinia graminis f. sp. tritici]